MADSRFLLKMAIACMALLSMPRVGGAVPLLIQTLQIATDHQVISVSYPAYWSVAQPTVNSWVILNVPASQQDSATPTVRVVIGYLQRVDHGDAVSQLAEYAQESQTPGTFLAI